MWMRSRPVSYLYYDMLYRGTDCIPAGQRYLDTWTEAWETPAKSPYTKHSQSYLNLEPLSTW